jgi:hypothetical protein
MQGGCGSSSRPTGNGPHHPKIPLWNSLLDFGLVPLFFVALQDDWSHPFGLRPVLDITHIFAVALRLSHENFDAHVWSLSRKKQS